MFATLISVFLLGAAPSEDSFMQGQTEGTWTYANGDVSKMINLTLIREKSFGGYRRKVILQVTSSVQFPGRRSTLTRAWTGTYSIAPGEDETRVECNFTKGYEPSIGGKLVPSDIFRAFKVTFHASEYGAPERIPEMMIRFSGREGLYIWDAGEEFRFLHSAK